MRDGEVRPPLLTDAGQWRQVVFGEWKRLTVKRMDDGVLRYTVEADAAKKTLTLSPEAERAPKILLAYAEPEAGQVCSIRGTCALIAARAAATQPDSLKFST